MATALQMTDSQQTRLSVSEVDKKGNPVDPGAAGFATPQWASSDPSIVAITPSVDGADAVAVAAGKLGTAQITVTVATGADQPLTGTLDVTVVAGAAASIVINADAPGEQ